MLNFLNYNKKNSLKNLESLLNKRKYNQKNETSIVKFKPEIAILDLRMPYRAELKIVKLISQIKQVKILLMNYQFLLEL